MLLVYGLFRRKGRVVKSEAFESGARVLTVVLEDGKQARIELEREELQTILGPPAQSEGGR